MTDQGTRPGRRGGRGRVALFLACAVCLSPVPFLVGGADAQPAGGGPAPGAKPPQGVADIELVEQVLAARREYQRSLERLRAHYLQAGDVERQRWAEEELRHYHRILKQAYRLDLDVPPPTLQGTQNIPEANNIYRRAVEMYKDKGWGLDYVDNMRRAELLLQLILSNYPQCNKISDAAYQLGDIYESKGYRMYRRAAMYFERCFQWNPNTHFDARIRAARLYDQHLLERGRAIELYREVTTHETDAKRIQEAEKRLGELSGSR